MGGVDEEEENEGESESEEVTYQSVVDSICLKLVQVVEDDVLDSRDFDELFVLLQAEQYLRPAEDKERLH